MLVVVPCIGTMHGSQEHCMGQPHWCEKYGRGSVQAPRYTEALSFSPAQIYSYFYLKLEARAENIKQVSVGLLTESCEPPWTHSVKIVRHPAQTASWISPGIPA